MSSSGDRSLEIGHRGGAVQAEENMTEFVPWDSQPLDEWARKHAPGRFIDCDGRRTHYVVQGQGPPVVLIHGFNLDLNTWSRNVDALAEQFTVYALDLWGSGYSSREPVDYGYPLFADQLRSFMDGVGLERAHIMGHSMGGGTAIYFSLHNRHRVDRLVLVDPVGVPRRLPLRGRLFMLPVIPELLLGLKTDAIRRKNLLDYWIYDGDLLTDECFEMVTRYQKIEGTTRALLQILRKDFFNTLGDEIPTLGKLDIPILIAWGRHDRSVPLESGHTMHRLLPGSRLEIFEGAAHLPNLDRAEEFNQLAIEFLGGAAS